MPSGVTRFSVWAVAACAAFAAAKGAAALEVQVPWPGVALLGGVAAVLAATAAVRNVAYAFRGPVVVSFRRADGILCDARESELVRGAAQLRGTMGGAGWVFPRRLASSAAAWAFAAAAAVVEIQPGERAGSAGSLLLAAAGVAVLAAARFPATPFFYREAAAGCVVVFPPDAWRRLLATSAAGAVLRPVMMGGGAPGTPGDHVAATAALDGEGPGPDRADRAKS